MKIKIWKIVQMKQKINLILALKYISEKPAIL